MSERSTTGESTSPSRYDVLVVEDSPIDVQRVERLLRVASSQSATEFRPTCVTTLGDALRQLPESTPSVVLLDLYLPDFEGPEVVEMVLTVAPRVAVVVMTGHADPEMALEVVRRGASDCLAKEDLSADLLQRSLLFSMERVKNRIVAERSARDRQERFQAGRLQANLLPRSTPRVDGYDIAGAYRPADKIGGDLFDVIALGDGEILCHVADVSGHSLASALIMAGLRRVVRTLANRIDCLLEFAEAINEAVYEDTTSFQFVTQFLARLDAKSRKLRYVAAGHMAFVLRENGEWERLPSQMPPFGIAPGIPDFEPQEIQLEPGDLVVLPTDGFAEAQDPDGTLWGMDRLRRTVTTHRHESAETLVGVLMGSILEFCRPDAPKDDCSIVVFKVL